MDVQLQPLVQAVLLPAIQMPQPTSPVLPSLQSNGDDAHGGHGAHATASASASAELARAAVTALATAASSEAGGSAASGAAPRGAAPSAAWGGSEAGARAEGAVGSATVRRLGGAGTGAAPDSRAATGATALAAPLARPHAVPASRQPPVVSPASASCSKSGHRRQLDPASLDEALELAAQSAAVEQEGPGDWVDNTWEEAVKLWPLLNLAVQPEFAPPPRFQQAMETCMVCLLHAPQGRLCHARRMAELLDSPDAGPLLSYLDWLETALREVAQEVNLRSSASSCRTVLVPQRVRSALCSWPAERALLQQSAVSLWEALLAHGPEHHRSYVEWRKSVEARDTIQVQQEEECVRVAQELEGAAAFFSGQLREASGMEWPQLARTTQASLWNIQQLTTDMMQSQRDCWSHALEKYEALGARARACRASVSEARRQVRRHEQAFGQAAQRFTEVASQLVAWTSVLVPKLRLLEARREELREAVELRLLLPALEREHLAAEDELDVAQTELRKHRRHAQAGLRAAGAARSRRSPRTPEMDAVAGAVLARQYELRVTHTGGRVQTLAEQLREAERRLQEAEGALPLELEPDDDGSAPTSPRHRELLSSEERLAMKLASLEQFHEDMAVQVSEVHAERERELVMHQVADRKAEEALRRRMEPDFMCPIMHERLTEPVLAADGHTYERAAIEKWLQLHNTSPMTGAPLAHRYLTENFALRHLIAAYDAELAATEGTDGGRIDGTGCDDAGSAAGRTASPGDADGDDEDEDGEGDDDYQDDYTEDQEDERSSQALGNEEPDHRQAVDGETRARCELLGV